MARPKRQPFTAHLSDFRRKKCLTQEQVAETLSITVESVRRHEQALSMPTPMYRQAYCDLYGARESELWLQGEPNESRSIGTIPILPEHADFVEPLAPTLAIPAPPLVTEYAGDEYLGAVQGYVRSLVSLDNRFGGADLVRLAVRFFKSVQNQLGSGAYDPLIESDLYAAAGELAEVVGWLAYDAEQHDLVRQMNQESLYFTRLCGDRRMELLTVQNASMHAGALGRPAEALRLARSVLEGEYTLSPRLQALFLTRKARAMAQGGDESSIKIFRQVESLFLEGLSDTDPAWAWWIDERELAWHEAMAQRDLNRGRHAISGFERSVEATRPTEVRSQYLHRAYLLRAQMEMNEWPDFEATIKSLIPLASQVASTRTVLILRDVVNRVARHEHPIPGAATTSVGQLGTALDTLAI